MAAAATMATSMAIPNPKTIFHPNPSNPTKQTPRFPIQTRPKPLSAAPPAVAGTALAGAFFSALSSAEPAFAAQQLAEIADADSRGAALLVPLVPALLWVLYNILPPALNQINRMRSSNAAIVGLGLAGLALLHPPEASAAAAEAATDNRGQLLLLVVAPAILWVLYNILQPALNQINRMRSK